MPEQKLSYEERIEIEKVRLAKAAFRTTWEYALDKDTNTESSLHRAAISSIAAQAEAIRAFNSSLSLPQSWVEQHLLEHGYIEPKTEEDGENSDHNRL